MNGSSKASPRLDGCNPVLSMGGRPTNARGALELLKDKGVPQLFSSFSVIISLRNVGGGAK